MIVEPSEDIKLKVMNFKHYKIYLIEMVIKNGAILVLASYFTRKT